MKFRIFVSIALLGMPWIFPAGIANAAGKPANSPVDIREWLVPWEDSRPRDPYVASDGVVWFVGQRGHYVASLDPVSGEFRRIDLDLGTGPHNLIVDEGGMVWYAGNLARHIGIVDPGSGSVTKIEMPEETARDPHTLTFDSAGDIWFTVQHGNFVGRLSRPGREVDLKVVPTAKARPYGIVVDQNDIPWAVEFGSHKLLKIDPDDLSLTEIDLPNTESRPRRLGITSDGNVWYVDYALGILGRYDPASSEFSEWPLPHGADSKPYGMAVDRNDRIWLVETGVSPNRFVGFDTTTEKFVSSSEIPSGGGAVRHMNYFEPRGEVWFGTDTNYIGRAIVH
jgi:virginiamycin B lyase